LINSKGKDTVHKELITQVLKILMKPEKIAVVHILGHQKVQNMEAQENKMANEAFLQLEIPIFYFSSVILPPSIVPKFCPQEEK
jgi:fatty acid-binding protein DegV